MRPLFAFCLICLAALAAPAVAQSAAKPSPAQMSAMLERVMKADSNADGFVSRTEWLAYRAEQFTRFDRNKDGYLTESDVPGFMRNSDKGAMLIQTIKDFDANHDGRLSRDEFVHGPTLAFDAIDRDHNDILDPQELKQAKGTK
jgi:hypothetical protein